MTDPYWPGAEDLRKQLTEQLAVEARFPGWQVLHTTCDRWVRNIEIRGGFFYAVHYRATEPPVMAADLIRLAHLLKRRQRGTPKTSRRAIRSGLRRALRCISRSDRRRRS